MVVKAVSNPDDHHPDVTPPYLCVDHHTTAWYKRMPTKSGWRWRSWRSNPNLYENHRTTALCSQMWRLISNNHNKWTSFGNTLMVFWSKEHPSYSQCTIFSWSSSSSFFIIMIIIIISTDCGEKSNVTPPYLATHLPSSFPSQTLLCNRARHSWKFGQKLISNMFLP